MEILNLIMKAEIVGLETEEELIDYTVALIVSGLVNSTGSNQRFVAQVMQGEYADSVRAKLEEVSAKAR